MVWWVVESQGAQRLGRQVPSRIAAPHPILGLHLRLLTLPPMHADPARSPAHPRSLVPQKANRSRLKPLSGAQRRKIRRLSDHEGGDMDDIVEEAAGAALAALMQAQVGAAAGGAVVERAAGCMRECMCGCMLDAWQGRMGGWPVRLAAEWTKACRISPALPTHVLPHRAAHAVQRPPSARLAAAKRRPGTRSSDYDDDDEDWTVGGALQAGQAQGRGTAAAAWLLPRLQGLLAVRYSVLTSFFFHSAWCCRTSRHGRRRSRLRGPCCPLRCPSPACCPCWGRCAAPAVVVRRSCCWCLVGVAPNGCVNQGCSCLRGWLILRQHAHRPALLLLSLCCSPAPPLFHLCSCQ